MMRDLVNAVIIFALAFLAMHPKPVEKAYVVAVNTLCADYPHDIMCNELKYIALP
jgi:hypothetical protein